MAQLNSTPTSEDARLFDQARQRYYEAVEGNQDALDESRNLLHKLRTKNPKDSLILAYLGSTLLLEAARAVAPWRKGRLAKEGLRMLDEAVKQSPENLDVRFLRGVSTSHLPSFFKRAQQSAEDFAWLAPRAPDAVATGRLDARLGAACLYHHGLALEKAGNLTGARTAWQETVRLGPGTRAAADARKKLAVISE